MNTKVSILVWCGGLPCHKIRIRIECFRMKHTCATLILHCIDFRFGKEIKKYLEQRDLLGNCDIVAVAGVAKNIASPAVENDREFVVRQIDISKKLHDIKEVIVMNHTDCGAYGGRAAFASEEEEKMRHIADMQKAQEIIRAKHSDCTVTTVLAHIDSVGAISFEEIA